ncbi:hypothetical protein [Salipiger sp.]|uniref:hypothetical protein n=1 Tax=Salipiger sp. TaxID=2078585 RepID=UPI003A96AB1A
MTRALRILALFAALFWQLSTPAAAEPRSIVGGGLFGARAAILPSGGMGAAGGTVNRGSLFAGRDEGGLLAPRKAEPVSFTPGIGVASAPLAPLARTASAASRAEWVRHLIARAEAGRAGYDAVNHGARRKPPRAPTQMTVSEIYAWIDATPGQPHAIGRYQFIPATLKRLVSHLGINPRSTFSPVLQDRLADQLLEEAGFSDLMTGNLSRRGFMNNIAKIWAGLPNSGGKSHYHGYAGNRATMTWAQFESEMARIFPG